MAKQERSQRPEHPPHPRPSRPSSPDVRRGPKREKGTNNIPTHRNPPQPPPKK